MPFLPQDIYYKHLQKINNIKLTRREIDIISCLLNGRSVKVISRFLPIKPKTIETHIRNIMTKLECSSRDGIIDFIEKSGTFSIIKEYYLSLVTCFSFEKALREIATLAANESPTCLIVCWKDNKYEDFFSSI